MNDIPRDYRFLLQDFLPRLSLPRSMREANAQVLARGSPEDIRYQSLLSLEALTDAGRLTRDAAKDVGGRVGLTYRKGPRGDRVGLMVSRELWADVKRKYQGASADWVRIGEEGRTVVSEREDADVDHEAVTEVIRTLGVDGYPLELYRRSLGLLELAEKWMPGSHAEILVLDENELPPEVWENGSPRWRAVSDGAKSFLANPWVEAGPYRFDPIPDALQDAFPDAGGADSLATCPLRVEGDLWGYVAVRLPAAGPDPARLLDRVALLGRIHARVLDNARVLAGLVEVDPLTGVLNRSAYDQQVSLEIERAHRLEQQLALLVVDIDHFKQFNDRFGHLVGDKILRATAGSLKASLRKIDFVYRYGGEEFVLMLPSTNRKEAYLTAERLRATIQEMASVLDSIPGQLSVTVSIGGCIYPEDAANENELFHLADQALLTAKSSGRNRVVFHGFPQA